MANPINKVPKKQYWDYFILVARFLLGWTFLRYGYSKLVDSQFGVTDAELATPLKDVSLFRLSWYLFDHQPFKAFIGISQVICGGLLIINRTTIIGAFLFLPIVSTILIIDLSYMPPDHKVGFAWRLPFYILLDLLILWHYRERMTIIWNAAQGGLTTKFRFPVWAYLALPVMAIALDITGILPKILTNLVLDPENTLQALKKLPPMLIEVFHRIFDEYNL